MARPRLWPTKSGKPGRGRTFPQWPAATATRKHASKRTPTVAVPLRVAESRAEALSSVGKSLWTANTDPTAGRRLGCFGSRFEKPGSASVCAPHGRTVEPRRCDVYGLGDRLSRGSEQPDARPSRPERARHRAESEDGCEPKRRESRIARQDSFSGGMPSGRWESVDRWVTRYRGCTGRGRTASTPASESVA